MDKNELKIQALREKIGIIVSRYEDEIADIRVDATQLYENYQELEDRVKRLEQEKANLEAKLAGFAE